MNLFVRWNLMVAVMICGLSCGVGGCKSTTNKLAAINPIGGIGETEPPEGVPERVVATWTEAVLHQNAQGTRGFGGRLFFYERGSAEPIRVQGQLVVYAFAEKDRQPSDNKPTKRYVFPPEQFAKHESKSDLGTSYSVWLPWDAAGGEQAEVSLIARFEPSQGGGLVVSDQTRQRLPGRAPQQALASQQEPKATIQQASSTDGGQAAVNQALYQQSASEPSIAPRKPGLKATTISLPNRFRRQAPSAATTSVAGVDGVGNSTANTTLQSTPVGTTVDYLTPGESVRRSVQRRSFDSLR